MSGLIVGDTAHVGVDRPEGEGEPFPLLSTRDLEALED